MPEVGSLRSEVWVSRLALKRTANLSALCWPVSQRSPRPRRRAVGGLDLTDHLPPTVRQQGASGSEGSSTPGHGRADRQERQHLTSVKVSDELADGPCSLLGNKGRIRLRRLRDTVFASVLAATSGLALRGRGSVERSETPERSGCQLGFPSRRPTWSVFT